VDGRRRVKGNAGRKTRAVDIIVWNIFAFGNSLREGEKIKRAGRKKANKKEVNAHPTRLN